MSERRTVERGVWQRMTSALARGAGRLGFGTATATDEPNMPAFPAEIAQIAAETPGFLDEEEGLKLFELAVEASSQAPCLEVGSYCGKSTLYLAAGCRQAGGHPVFAVDHHRGSVEQQKGEEYFDEALYDAELDSIYTLDRFIRTLHRAGLDSWVIPVVTHSKTLAEHWPGTRLGLLFIDGGHAIEDVTQDYEGWAQWILPGGFLCVHDIYHDPAEGGQAPRTVFERAQQSDDWLDVGQWGSLGVLRRAVRP